MTNLERLKLMSAEEIAKLLAGASPCVICQNNRSSCDGKNACYLGIVDFLNLEEI